jgi:hypothetical protein
VFSVRWELMSKKELAISARSLSTVDCKYPHAWGKYETAGYLAVYELSVAIDCNLLPRYGVRFPQCAV